MNDAVLIHGGTTTGAYWDRLRPLLVGRSFAPDLPGRRARPGDLMELTVDGCVASLCADIDETDLGEHVVLVAHSSGGLFAPGVARHLGSRLVHIVLSSASVPPSGGTGLDCMKPQHAQRCRAAMEDARRTGRLVTTLDGASHAHLEVIRSTYGGDPLPDELASFMAEPMRRVPDSFNVYFQPVTWEGVPDVGITYLLNLRDRAIPLDLQWTMIDRLPSPPVVVEIDGGHIPSVTEPGVVASVINAVV